MTTPRTRLLAGFLCHALAGLSHPALASPPGAPLSASQGHRVIRYLALGDSFTAGTGSPPGRDFPAQVVARFRAAGREVVGRNLGVNGYTTQDLIDEEIPAVKAFSPTVVTLAIGANDLVRGRGGPHYRAQVKKILGLLKAAGVDMGRVYALPQPEWWRSPVAAGFGDPERIARDIASSNAVLREETLAAGGHYLDLSPLLDSQARAGQVAPDGLHPSSDAYRAWGDAVFEELSRKTSGI